MERSFLYGENNFLPGRTFTDWQDLNAQARAWCLQVATLKPEQINAFFKLMAERYGRKSSIITTNLDYPEWYELFQRKTLVDALLDRLNHHCITIRINGPSLRVASNAKGKTKTKP